MDKFEWWLLYLVMVALLIAAPIAWNMTKTKRPRKRPPSGRHHRR